MQMKARQIRWTPWLLLLALVATAAMAANPQFLRAPSAQLGSPKVIVSWTEVGLGDLSAEVEYLATANAAATYQCVNRGNKCPEASNKEDVMAPVSSKGTFSVGKNGRISASMEIEAPPSTLVCPGNQVVSVATVVFTDIRLTDTTNDVTSETNPNTLTYNALECP